MNEIVRNILRRKVRSALTIFGIAIGIFALSVMGSMSEYFNSLIDRSIRYSSEIVRVTPKAAVAGPASSVLQVSEVDQFKKIPEVRDAAPAMYTTLSDEGSGANLLSGELAIGIPPKFSEDLFSNVGLRDGRFLKDGDTTQILVGFGLAQKHDLKIGSKQTFRGKEFEVVGIGKQTQVDQVDNMAIVPLSAVQELNRLPNLANGIILFPKETDQAQKIADTVKKDFADYNALSPEDLVNETRQGLLIFNVIILAGAFLAAVVGGFSTLNTMIMSVTERTREIGVKKAIGASNLTIIKEYLAEAAIIGLIGGVVGVTLGYLATIGINQITREIADGLAIFSLTPRLALVAIAFAIVLGSIAGLIPAINAARMNVVKALHEE